MTVTFMLIFPLNTHSYAFHENLGIDDNKASELYHTNPNDPAIVRWKNALQLAISGMDKCFTIQEAISCQSLIPTIISNCKSHPNTLLACNDTRFAQYPSILKQAQEAQKRAEEAQLQAKKKAEEAQLQELKKDFATKMKESAASVIIDRCIQNSKNSSDASCDGQLRSLERDCQSASTPYSYCNDKRFVGYLIKNGILNSTVSRYSNLTGNSSSSNSTYP
jgi:hypothetical protein